MPIRDIIVIDEEKCDGCGKCVSACEEGAIALVDGKAKLVKEYYCDGLGACIGECPRGAITIEQREAPAFVEPEDNVNVSSSEMSDECGCHNHSHDAFQCPGSAVRELRQAHHRGTLMQNNTIVNDDNVNTNSSSQLLNWPVQLKLIPVNAPYLQNAHLLIAADCTCCTLPDFHQKLLKGKILIIACPKLDDARFYTEKLTQMFKINKISHITLAYMEVPCCGGLIRIVESAIADSGTDIAVTKVKIGINGNILEIS